jgi:hypothetical protein
MFKTKLNEFCHKSSFQTPIYLVGNPEGLPHNPIYTDCTVGIGDKKYTFRSKASSKKELENLAAEETLKILENMVITHTEKLVSKSAKTKKFSNQIYLIDFDNCADINLQNLSGEIHIFIAQNFNTRTKKMNTIKNLPNVEIHQAEEPLPEMVDHMMTWYACENFKKIKQKEVIVVSKDSGLYALVALLKQKAIKAKITC